MNIDVFEEYLVDNKKYSGRELMDLIITLSKDTYFNSIKTEENKVIIEKFNNNTGDVDTIVINYQKICY